MPQNLPASWIPIVLLAGCSFGPSREPISDQLNPEGPCWSVDLSDGLDDQSTEELHQLFNCLNRTGNLEPFVSLDSAFEAEDRSGDPVGLTLVRMGNELPRSPFDVLGLVGQVLELLRDRRDDVVLAMEMVVEGIYSRPYSEITNDFDLDDPAALEQGLAKPAIKLLARIATVMLDAGPGLRERVVEGLDSELTQSGICTFTTVMDSGDPEIESMVDTLIPHLAEAWSLSNDTSNNLWDRGSGNSIRDLVELVEQRIDAGAMENIEAPLLALLSDTLVQANTKQVLSDTVDAGHVDTLPDQLLYLASVDVKGRALTAAAAADISALQAGIRLIHRANQPLSCTAIIELPLVDNMAVTILQELAQLETREVEDSLGFLVDILEGDFAPWFLESLADQGLCDGFTPGLLEDMKVLERLNDPEVGNLVEVIHGMLDAVYPDVGEDRVEELVQVLADLHAEGLIPPVEEVLRDLVSSPMLDDITTVIPAIIDPGQLGDISCEEPVVPLHYDQIWEAAREALETGDSNENHTAVITDTLLDSDELWLILDRGAQLGLEPDAHIHAMPSFVMEILTSEAAEGGSDMIRDTLEDEDIWEGTLTIIESHAIRDAVLEPSEEVAGPLPYLAHLIVSDTVTVMLQTLDLVLDSLGGNKPANP